jgi:hypothetical protein
MAMAEAQQAGKVRAGHIYREQTLVALVRKGLLERVSGTTWFKPKESR